MRYIFKPSISTYLLLFILLFTTGSLTAQGTKQSNIPKNEKTLRVLIIGNSFSKNATQYLPQLAEEGGHKLFIQKAEIGGAALKTHWDAVKIAEAYPDSSKGKPYGKKSLKELLMDGNWDIITMQQASTVSAYADGYYPYVKDLYSFIRKFQPKAEIIIHQTWAYRTDAPYFSKVEAVERAKDAEEMWVNSRAAYHKVAKEFNLRIIPTGDAFWAISSDPKWKFVMEADYNFDTPIYPELPKEKNSLNVGYYWTKNKKLKLDTHHANAAGCYLGSLVWYSVFFKETPVNLQFVPDKISVDFAEQLRKTASTVVFN